MLPLGFIFNKYNISFHCFADDIQIYLPLQTNKDGIIALQTCLKDVESWMESNFLRLNENMT